MTETSQWWSATVRGRELNDKGSVHDEVDRWGVVLVCHPGVVWRMWYVATKLAWGGGWEVSDLRRSWQQLPWVWAPGEDGKWVEEDFPLVALQGANIAKSEDNNDDGEEPRWEEVVVGAEEAGMMHYG